jgi:hypothetical protein
MEKGQIYRRSCDGFTFVVVHRTNEGANLQCLNATRLYNWYSDVEISRRFLRLPAKEARLVAIAAIEHWKRLPEYPEMLALAQDTLRRLGGVKEP